ncbi:MAG TPA: metallophosphoesterase, partial [Candidatus Omnitrophota bacterium]|nr:metallophosphoesterase [Candidatus Omnitrophota bacterium]
MKKILHMSDLHVGYQDFDLRFRRLIDAVIAQYCDEASDLVVVITGDLANNANKVESFRKVKQSLEALRQAGFAHILVVPGNHDHGTGKLTDEKFGKIFQEIFYGRSVEFPKLDIIDGMAFLGLNSMEEELHWYDRFWAEGDLGMPQLRRLEKVLLSPEVRICKKRVIYLHHHPFKWRPFHELKDSKELKKVLIAAMNEGVSIDALLFGHNHQGKAHNGEWGIPRCYDAGTATLKPRPKYLDWFHWYQIQASTRIIDLANDDVSSDSVFFFNGMTGAG